MWYWLTQNLNNQNETSEKNCDNLYPLGSKPEILYGLSETHKTLEDGIPAFHPISSAIVTPTYKVEKLFDKLVKIKTIDEYTIKDSFSAAKEFEEIHPNLIVTNFDVKSIFNNIPLPDTIGLFVENLYWNLIHFDGLSKSSVHKLL